MHFYNAPHSTQFISWRGFVVEKKGYTLVICEKPDAAKKIAEALAESIIEEVKVDGVPAFSLIHNGEKYIICASLGHIYTVGDPFGERSVYPVFDIEWFPYNLVNENAKEIGKRIESIKNLSQRATKFINACDYDVEGETIGYNILKYVCGGKEKEALRAKFSTLTKQELLNAFESAKKVPYNYLAAAGRARHVIDFIWGVNLSRVLSESLLSVNGSYKTLSIGRVQGPTLSFVVQREIEIQSFVPRPFWSVKGIFEKGGVILEASYSKPKIFHKEEAEKIKNECLQKEAFVSEVSNQIIKQPPPPPFNLGDLQKESHRWFGISPNKVLQVAERLYLEALISYPRTNSQKLPSSIGFETILEKLSSIQEYSNEAREILNANLKPVEGEKDDPAHPAIYPTGERPVRQLTSWESKLYDLIVRRFFAAFGQELIKEKITANILLAGHIFRLYGSRIRKEGWMKYYKYVKNEEKDIPLLNNGERLSVIEIRVDEKFESRPARYNEASLLDKMERENIGTKATRAEVISTLIERGYITSEPMVATELGFSIVEAMERYSPLIISTDMTRNVEQGLEAIELGQEDPAVIILNNIQTLSKQILSIKPSERKIGEEIKEAVRIASIAQRTLGSCPMCKNGKLILVFSKKSKKRFVGCTNHINGCKASAPLPQHGSIKATKRTCKYCSWPIILVKTNRRYPWNLCVNVLCPRKQMAKSYEMLDM